jgi:hypothetical protein
MLAFLLAGQFVTFNKSLHGQAIAVTVVARVNVKVWT